MSALTFDTLSAELTQALAEQSDTPPQTTARCTLGREKVMVLVEYPLDSAKAEPRASDTLDWLEQHLRDQFDTTGLPEEVADISDSIDEVAVQLYLKHLSEAKPFTMRSFTWKVDDGFDDLFGDASVDEAEADAPKADSEERAAELNGNSVSVAELADTLPIEGSGAQLANSSLVNTTPQRHDKLDKSLVFEEILSGETGEPPALISLPEGEEDLVLSELAADHLPLDIEPEMDLTLALEDTEDAESLRSLEQRLESGADLSLELGAAQHIAANLDDASAVISSKPISVSADLEADLSEGLNAPEVIIPETPEELSLPGEAPTLASSELDLPTVELPAATAATSSPATTDFFDLADELPAVATTSGLSSLPEVDFSSAFAATESPLVSTPENIDLFDVTSPQTDDVQLENTSFETIGNNDTSSLGIFAFEDNSPSNSPSNGDITEIERVEEEPLEEEPLEEEPSEEEPSDNEFESELENEQEYSENGQPSEQVSLESLLFETSPGSELEAESTAEPQDADLEERLFDTEDSSETTANTTSLEETNLSLDELVSSHEDLDNEPVSEELPSANGLLIDELFVDDSAAEDSAEDSAELSIEEEEEGSDLSAVADAIAPETIEASPTEEISVEEVLLEAPDRELSPEETEPTALIEHPEET
ncbi:MAG: hypothetical protein AAFP07_05530, partial [Cyanobacteria bacterium J06606_4]